MNSDFQLFNTIWNKYSSLVPCDTYEFDQYMKIITKIRSGDFDFSNCKPEFMILLYDMCQIIIHVKENIDDELQCCKNIKKYLENSSQNF
jgi:hypothetical protein